jgi:hypothetical protein
MMIIYIREDGYMCRLYTYTFGAKKYSVCLSYVFSVRFVHKVAILMGQFKRAKLQY